MLEPNRPVDEEARLHGLDQLDIVDTAREDRFDRLVRLAARTLGAPMAAVSFIERDREWFKSGHGWTAKEIPRKHSLGAHAILGTTPFVVEDLKEDERFQDHPLVPGVRSYAAVPLRAPNGGHIGVLAIMDREPRILNHEEMQCLEDLGRLTEDEIAARPLFHGSQESGDAAMLRALAHASPMACAVVDEEGIIAFRNDAWRQAGALASREDRKGTNLVARLEAEQGFHAEAAADLARAIQEVLRGDREAARLDVDTDGVRPRSYHVTVEPAGAMALVIMEDRTDAAVAARMQEAIVSRGLEAESLRSEKRYLAHVVDRLSQDINTPITPIRLQLHLLQSGRHGSLNSNQQRAVETVRRNVERWSQLTQGLLDLLSAETDAPPVDVALDGVAEEAVRSYRTKALKAGIKLHSRVSPATVRTDSGAVRQVLSHYLENAFQACSAGGRIEVEVHDEGKEATLVVRDSGMGLEPAALARIFEGRPDQAVDGHGLGLLHCKLIAQSLGGRVWAESDGLGQGAAFGLALPKV